jgi:hypothetical protein
MKVLFLDIDGVLNTPRTAQLFGNQFINPFLVELVAQVVAATDAKIILSSNWRIDEKELVEEALSKHNLEIFDCTPIFDPYELNAFHPRSWEIRMWLDDNEVEKFATIDDDPKANLKEGSFFQVDETIGLTEEITERVITHLNA